MSEEVISEVEKYKEEYTEKEWQIVAPILNESYNNWKRIQSIQNDTIGSGFNSYNLKVLNEIVKKLLVLSGIIGVQALDGPVGIVFLLDNHNSTNISSFAVETRSRKVRAAFNIEAIQDSSAINEIVEHEILDNISASITNEYVEEVIGHISKNAFRALSCSGGQLIKKIKDESDYFTTKSNKQKGNFVILSNSNFRTIFGYVIPWNLTSVDILDTGKVIDNGDIDIKVYVSPLCENDVIVGYGNNTSQTDKGLVLAPYKLNFGIVMVEATFAPKVEISTRYGVLSDKERMQRYYTIFKVESAD